MEPLSKCKYVISVAVYKPEQNAVAEFTVYDTNSYEDANTVFLMSLDRPIYLWANNFISGGTNEVLKSTKAYTAEYEKVKEYTDEPLDESKSAGFIYE